MCAECGYTMGRSSGPGGRGGRVHYYRCHGIDAWRRPQGAVCDNPPTRARELDTAVWEAVLRLLGNPELVQSEIERRLAAARDTASHDRRIAELRAESSRNHARMRRLDAYQEGLVPLDELRDRNAPLHTRERAIRIELDALTASKLDRESRLALPPPSTPSTNACAPPRTRCRSRSASASSGCSSAKCGSARTR